MEDLDVNSIISAISKDRGLPKDRVEQALKSAFIKTAKDVINRRSKFDVDFSEETPVVYEILTVVSDSYKYSKDNEIEGAIKISEVEDRFPDEDDIKIGDELQIPYDLSSFGRNASESLYVNIEKSIEETRGNSLYFEYKGKIGEKIRGKVIHIDKDENTIIDVDSRDIRAIIRRRDRIKGEKFRVGNEVTAVIKYVKIERDDSKITLELSRTNLKFLESLFKLAVPELEDGVITIEGSARIPGERAKVAVRSMSPRVDAISAMIGTKGGRINSVSRELNGEVIDVINFSSIPEVYIKNALSPASVGTIKIGETEDENGEKFETAYVLIDKSERGKAIGRAGVNLRLAKMLTGYEIRLLTNDNGDVKKSGTDREEKKLSADDVLGALFK
jgi:N utilization substance protein A